MARFGKVPVFGAGGGGLGGKRYALDEVRGGVLDRHASGHWQCAALFEIKLRYFLERAGDHLAGIGQIESLGS
jgi:hypothetical protein